MTSIRTRFAPSPTGDLHLGNARVAVFNWLYTRHHGGSFVVRVEDTDVERNVEGALEQMLDDLRWLGVDWDEGPDVGGPFGPYRQSERADRHRGAADGLLEAGKAYLCFCDAPDGADDADSTGGGAFRYPGTCKSLAPAEAAARRASGAPAVVRFAVPAGDIVVHDEVRGDVTFPDGDFDDFVLVRRDGRATYNFAVVVDDVEMGITDVVRGAGHLSNTPKQAVLFDALGRERPRFAHLPMVLGEDRRKLSKREGALSLASLREAGYPPSAVVNYLSLLGWSSPDGEEILSVDELVAQMDLDRVGASNTVLDPEKMRWMSAQHVARMPLDELVTRARPFVDRDEIPLDDDQLPGALEVIRSRTQVFGDVGEHLSFFHPRPGPELDRARAEVADDAGAVRVLGAVADRLAGVDPWTDEAVSQAVREAGKAVGARGPALFHPLRKAIAGRESGPDVARVMAVLGRDESLARIEATLQRRTV